MQRVFLITLFLISFVIYSGEKETRPLTDRNELLWPIQNVYPGENVITSPSDPILNTHFNTYQPNYGYIIEAKLGDPVVASHDGTVYHVSRYSYSDDHLMSFSSDDLEDIIGMVKNRKDFDPKWINSFVGIKFGDGEVIWYDGLDPKTLSDLKTGDKVKRGDVIGTVWYSYRFIDKPSISFSYDQYGKNADTELKLLGTNNHIFEDRKNQIKPNYKYKVHNIEELLNAVEILRESLFEMHPDIDNYDEIEEIIIEVKQGINRPLTSDQFFKRINPIIQLVKDNHTYLIRDYYYNDFYTYSPKPNLPIELTVVDNKCYILVDTEDKISRGSEIQSINDENITNIISDIKKIMPTPSGSINTLHSESLKQNFVYFYLFEKGLKPGDVIKVKTLDTEAFYTVSEKEVISSGEEDADKKVYSIEDISENIVLFTISSMSLTALDRETVKTYFSENITNNKTIILDIRNNGGGSMDDSNLVYDLFFDSEFTPEKELKVNSNGIYKSLYHSMNLPHEEALFSDFNKIEGREGYYKNRENNPEEFKKIELSNYHFSGDTYVLTNGYTGSAAVELAAYFKYFDRAAIIGSEGCEKFYCLNGSSYSKTRLGETGIQLNVPLIKIINNFDFKEGIPEDRGVIPDYLVEDTIEDKLSNNDRVLNFTIELINEKDQKQILIIVVAVSVIFVIIIFSLLFKRKFKSDKK